MFSQTLSIEFLKGFIQQAFDEDIGENDHTTNATIDDGMTGQAHLLVKSAGVIAGVELAQILYQIYDKQLKIDLLKKDGEKVVSGDIVFTVKGKYNSIITSERVLLNIMQRMSGIASQTASLCQQIAHTNATLLDTRKTTPLCRMIERWAVRIGGGKNHRMGLYDVILVKNNHIDACGGILPTLEKLILYKNKYPNIPIIIECRNEEEWRSVMQKPSLVQRILLDNMSPSSVQDIVRIINQKIPLEVSGNINQKNITAYAETGVNYISMGMLTHSVTALDMRLRVK